MMSSSPVPPGHESIQFRHFIPKDEDLKYFISTEETSYSSSMAEIFFEKVNTEFSDKINQAKESLRLIDSKLPIEPNWDLKREFEKRNKKLHKQSLKAIAILGKSNQSDDKKYNSSEDAQERFHSSNTEEVMNDETSPRNGIQDSDDDSSNDDFSEMHREVKNLIMGSDIKTQ